MGYGWLLDRLPKNAGRDLAEASLHLCRLTMEHAITLPANGNAALIGRALMSLNRRYAPATFETAFGAVMGFDRGDGIDRLTAMAGLWEPSLTYRIARSLRPGDTFVDVGAHSGYFTLLASRLVGPTGRVVAIEASPSTFEALRENVERNHATNVRCVHRAAMDVARDVEIGDDTNERAKRSIVREDQRAPAHGALVRGEPLDTILTADEVRTLRFIKIDVEGAEGLVLRGAREVVARAPRELEVACEVTPDWSGSDPAATLRPLLDAGFRMHYLPNGYELVDYLPATKVFREQPVDELPNRQTDCILRRDGAAAPENPMPAVECVSDLYRAVRRLAAS